MSDQIPRGKISRGFTSSKTAAKIGGTVLKYYAKKPFLSKSKVKEARKDLDQKGAEILFSGLSLLKGTALKLAQLLSLELDIFPETVRKELEKSYNQVPPINRALVRKIIQNSLGSEPEHVFRTFDLNAFAAASLGQVHLAETKTGEKIAVKVQYPDISRTISNDIQLVKIAMRPLQEYDLIQPALAEIETMLQKETDYVQEAKNVSYFSNNLNMDHVAIPKVYAQTSTKTILSLSHMEGMTLNEWLKQKPNQQKRDRVAQLLHDIFLTGLYQLNCIHADPNPGNFIISNDLSIGLLDFGCIKRFDSDFVTHYSQLPGLSTRGNKSEYLAMMKNLNITLPFLEKDTEYQIYKVFYQIGQWFGRLYHEEIFDFGKHDRFFRDGRKLMHNVYRLRKNFRDINPNFIFLDRTRYGLFRLFERMKARVRIRNEYEWN